MDRTFWDSPMNYFIREFLGLKIMIVVRTVIIFNLSEIPRDTLTVFETLSKYLELLGTL